MSSDRSTHATMTVYTPEPLLRRPGELVHGMVRDLLASRGLAWRLFVRNIGAQYRQTALGYVWAFVPPLVTTALWVVLARTRVLSVGETALGLANPGSMSNAMTVFRSFLSGILYRKYALFCLGEVDL